MNTARRKTIAQARALLEAAFSQMEEAKGLLEEARDEEQEYRDNMPEAFADGEKGERADEVVSQLEDAIGQIDELFDGTIYDCLEEAAQ